MITFPGVPVSSIFRSVALPDRSYPPLTVGYGAACPKAPNDTVDGRALHRRVELVRK